MPLKSYLVQERIAFQPLFFRDEPVKLEGCSYPSLSQTAVLKASTTHFIDQNPQSGHFLKKIFKTPLVVGLWLKKIRPYVHGDEHYCGDWNVHRTLQDFQICLLTPVVSSCQWCWMWCLRRIFIPKGGVKVIGVYIKEIPTYNKPNNNSGCPEHIPCFFFWKGLCVQ